MASKIQIDRYSLTPEGLKVARHLERLSRLPKFLRILCEIYDNAKLFISCAKDVYRDIYNEWRQKY